MKERVLIANRGVSATVVEKACNNLNIETVNVFTPEDINSPHAKGKSAHPITSYLNIPEIIGVARNTKSTMIHPGYGLNSENPTFAEECRKAGIIFVGPTAESMRLAGDKAKIKQIAREQGVPVIPSSPLDMDKEKLPEWVKNNKKWYESERPIEFPIMVKAATAGGGNGNQIVNTLEELPKAIQDVSRRAKKLGGASDKVFLEPVLPNVRHVEVQSLGDGNGNIIHLVTRDCSILANNQKLIEQAPATNLTQKQSDLICSYALKIAKAIGYTNAGTAEFLVDSEGEIYFMEFNPRLQVEHTVTERVTRVNIVDWQIRIALGEAFSIRQEDVKVDGVAIEGRVNAQTVYPAEPTKLWAARGKIEKVIFPEEGRHLRVDHCIEEGQEVNLDYNPNMANIIAWGSTREGGIKELREALINTTIQGVETTIPYLVNVLSDSRFLEEKHTTTFFEEMLRKMAVAPALQEREREGEVVVFYRNHSPWWEEGLFRQMESRSPSKKGWR